MLTLQVGTGLYLTTLLKGLQFRAFPSAFQLIWHKDHSHVGEISHFAAQKTALAATVGTGNIVEWLRQLLSVTPGRILYVDIRLINAVKTHIAPSPKG